MERSNAGVYAVRKSKPVTNPLPSWDNGSCLIGKNKHENGFLTAETPEKSPKSALKVRLERAYHKGNTQWLAQQLHVQ